MLEELCTFLRYASAIKEQKKSWQSWLKSLTGLKCCATTLNYKQQHAIGWANGNPTMLRPFARGLSDRFYDDEAFAMFIRTIGNLLGYDFTVAAMTVDA